MQRLPAAGEVATDSGCCPQATQRSARQRGAAGDDADGRRGRREADGGRRVDGDVCVRRCEIQATGEAALRLATAAAACIFRVPCLLTCLFCWATGPKTEGGLQIFFGPRLGPWP